MALTTVSKIANYFIYVANETGSYLSNLKLQKLLYYAQAWHLALYGISLFDEEFEAWIHGPVIVRNNINKHKHYIKSCLQ